MTLAKVDFPRMVLLPNLANGKLRNAGNQAWGTYGTLGNIPYDFVLLGIALGYGGNCPAGQNGTVFGVVVGAVAVGDVGGETHIAEWVHGVWIFKPGTTDSSLLGVSTNIEFAPTLIPAGRRIAVREWGNQPSGSVLQTAYYIYGYRATDWMLMRDGDDARYLRGLDTLPYTVRSTAIYPAPVGATPGAPLQSLTGAWEIPGAWFELVAAGEIPSAFRVPAIAVCGAQGGGAAPWGQIEIGVGPPGAEVSVDWVAPSASVTGGQLGGGELRLRRPISCPPRQRVVARVWNANVAETYYTFAKVELFK